MSENQETRQDAVLCSNCNNCQNDKIDTDESLSVQCNTESVLSKCETWLSKCSISSDGESVYSSESSGTNCSSTSGSRFEDEEGENETRCFSQAEANAPETVETLDVVQQIFNKQNVYGNVRVTDSKKVRLGNVTNIYGPVYITQAVSMVNQQSITNQVLSLPPPTKHGDLSILYRKDWLGLAPVQERTLLNAPAKFVIIAHTVSAPGDHTQAANTRLVQSIQRYHMVKRNWSDIASNFFIGSDGNVYEGRGWSVQSALAHIYNKASVGISFLGYFCEKLPTEEALNQAKILIRRGVEAGAIDENYSLLAHCQCSETDSPGEKLYEEIQKWDRWDRSIDVQHPSPLVSG